jgi:signal recognition particle subunit SRP54
MFDDLTQKLEGVLRRLRNEARLTEDNVGEALRDVRRALLEADVHLDVARDFVDRVKRKALGQSVLQSLQPGQQLVRIVHDELVELLGGTQAELEFRGHPAVILVAGLQGSGKTTFSAKLAKHLSKRGRRVLLAAADVYRPAAMDQLQLLGTQVGVPVWVETAERDVSRLVVNARAHARQNLLDTLIVDTAGRLHVDEELMNELAAVRAAVPPCETLLVVDAMTGQEAVQVARTFDARVPLTGVVLTKLDGDARGGAALSLRAVTQRPIKFVGTGEGVDDLDVFHPDRMARRILGMGDVLTLVEKAQEVFDTEQAQEIERKARKQALTLEDFLAQLQQVRRMGPLDKLMGMLPGVNSAMLQQSQLDPRQLDRVQGIVHAMTPGERRAPQTIDGSRRRRIARGSGTSVQEVNLLLKQFDAMKRMMKVAATNPKAAARALAPAGGVRYGGKRKGRR